MPPADDDPDVVPLDPVDENENVRLRIPLEAEQEEDEEQAIKALEDDLLEPFDIDT